MCTFSKSLSELDQFLNAQERQRARLIHLYLARGTGYSELGGKKLKRAPGLIRFKIGRYWRLIYRKHAGAYRFEAIISRKNLDQFLRCACRR